MKDTTLESNVVTQKKDIVSKFQSTNDVAKDVLERVETMYSYNQLFK